MFKRCHCHWLLPAKRCSTKLSNETIHEYPKCPSDNCVLLGITSKTDPVHGLLSPKLQHASFYFLVAGGGVPFHFYLFCFVVFSVAEDQVQQRSRKVETRRGSKYKSAVVTEQVTLVP